MFGLFDLIGSSFLPLMQFSFWVFGLSEQAEAFATPAVDASGNSSSDASGSGDTAKATTADGVGGSAAVTATADEDQSFIADPERAGDETGATPPGAFPQVNRAVQSYDGAPDLSGARAHSTIDAPTRVSESLAHFDDGSNQLSLHLLIEDENGLSLPRLEAGALAALQVHQAYFKAPMLVDIDTSLIDATRAEVTWTGTAAEAPALYLPFSMVIEDEAGFTADFEARLPVLTDDTAF